MPFADIVNWLSAQASLAGRPLWFDDPGVEACLGLLIAGYVAGLFSLRRSGRRNAAAKISRGNIAFFAGVAIAAGALLSPIDALGDRLFSVHMAQHLLLIVGAASLLAFSDAHVVLRAGLPRGFRASVARTRAAAGVAAWSGRRSAAWAAATAFVVTVWLWHIPAAHDFATENGIAHSLEHLTVLATATAFWRVVLTSGKRRISHGASALMASLVGLSGALLSALIMFAPAPLCRAYINNPLEDQVLAGLLMCIPASFAYVGSTVWVLWRMLSDDGAGDRRARTRS